MYDYIFAAAWTAAIWCLGLYLWSDWKIRRIKGRNK